MLRPFLVLCAVVALVLQLGAPADAVTGFGPSYRITTQRCFGLWTTEGTNGVTRGFAQCADHPVVNVAGSGGSWHFSYAPWTSFLLSAASDGSTDYALSRERNGIYLRYRTKDGVYHAGQRLSANQSDDGDIVVSAGKWWAVWSEIDGIHEAHTLGGTRASHLIFKADNQNVREQTPALAWSGSHMALVWTHALTQSQVSTRLSTSTGGAWTAAKTLSGTGFRPNVVYTGTSIAVARVEGAGCPCKIATFTGSPAGTLTKRLSTNAAWSGQPQIAYSSGRLNVAWVRYIDSSHYQLFVAERTGSTWSEARLSAPDDISVVDLTSAGGHARLFGIYGPGTVVARTQS